MVALLIIKNNANNTAEMRVLTQLKILCYDKWAELIKSLKTLTPQYITTNVLSITHNVTMSLSRDNVRDCEH